jgi:CO/xanthine dehydrogenase Mo-binding subunit
VGIARYKGTGAWCAVVADIAAEVRVDVRSLTVVADVGRVASRDGVLNQLEGGALQAMSWTILERSTVRDGHVVASGWSDYPILRFPDVPRVVADVIDRPDEPYLGAGEAAAGPTGAAICNALAHALGVRVTELPLTPEVIMRAVG